MEHPLQWFSPRLAAVGAVHIELGRRQNDWTLRYKLTRRPQYVYEIRYMPRPHTMGFCGYTFAVFLDCGTRSRPLHVKGTIEFATTTLDKFDALQMAVCDILYEPMRRLGRVK